MSTLYGVSSDCAPRYDSSQQIEAYDCPNTYETINGNVTMNGVAGTWIQQYVWITSVVNSASTTQEFRDEFSFTMTVDVSDPSGGCADLIPVFTDSSTTDQAEFIDDGASKVIYAREVSTPGCVNRTDYYIMIDGNPVLYVASSGNPPIITASGGFPGAATSQYTYDILPYIEVTW
jgi:hypothetical protein